MLIWCTISLFIDIIFLVLLLLFFKPEKETIALVKDALEFCESVPVISEETRSREKTVHQLLKIEMDEYVPSFNQLQETSLMSN